MSDTVTYTVIIMSLIALFGLGVWIVRQSLGAGSGPPVHQRLALVDTVVVDARRKLLLIRRDNVEHLIMTGGPVDVVVETGINVSVPPGMNLRDLLDRAKCGLEDPTIMTDEVPLILRRQQTN